MRFLIENTEYSLLIYLLISKEEEWKNTYFIFNYQMSNSIKKKLKEKVLSENIISQISSDKKIILRIKDYYKYYLRVIFTIIKDKKSLVYGNDNILFMTPFKFKNITLIEDGTVNYSFKKEKNYILKKLKNIVSLGPASYKPYGLSENVQKIKLTGLAPIPKEIAHKVEIIDLKELWDKKNLEEQNDILDIFSFNLNIKETIKDRDIIIFTQPLSEDGVITEDEKIEIYSKILNKYPQNKLIIKTHPREKTNYKEIFKGNLVLDTPFPFEILNLLDVKFKKAVTLFSTAALGLGEDVEVDFYGTEVNEKILAHFGSCDNIMKRNCYLKLEER